MRFPSKLYRLEESIIWKLPEVVKIVRQKPISVSGLCEVLAGYGMRTQEVIEALDCLYVLEKVEYDDKEGVLKYVGGNYM